MLVEIIYLFQKKIWILFIKSLKQEQNKYKFKLSGGDTTKSNKTVFTITSLGYSKKIVQEINVKIMMIFMLLEILVIVIWD